MADEKEVVVFEVDVSHYEKALVDLTKSINGLKDAQSKFAEEAKNGSVEAAKSYERVSAQLKIQQQEYRTAQNVLVGYNAAQQKSVDTQNFAKNSIQTNRDLLKQLTAQYINTANASPKLAAKVKELSSELKKQEQAIGDTRRNVGNYAEGFKDVIGAISQAIPGLNGAKGAQLGLNAAMEANPIGLVVAGLQVFSGVLSSIQPIMDSLEQTTAALSAGFGALVNGGDILEAASQAANLKKELQDLEDAQNGVNIANAEADARISRLLLQLRSKSITEKEAAEVSKKIQEEDSKRLQRTLEQEQAILDVKEKNFIISNNLSKRELDALVERGKTEVKFTEQGLQEIMRITGLSREEALAESKKNQEALADAAEKKILKDKDKFDEEIKLITDQRIKIIGIQEESDLLGEKLANRNEALSDKFQKQKEKRDADSEALLQKELSRLERLNIADAKALEELRNNAILQNEVRKQTGKTDEQIDKEFEERNQSKLTNFKEFAAEQLRIQKEINENSKRIQDQNKSDASALKQVKENGEKELALQRLYAERVLALVPESSEKTLMLKSIANNAQLDLDKEFADSNYATFAEFYEAKKKLYEEDIKAAKDAQAKGNQLSKDQISATTAIVGEGLSVISSVSSILDSEIQEKQDKLQLALDAGAIGRDEFAKQTTELKKKQFEQNKAVSLTSAILQGINATLAAYTSGAAIPIVGAVTGPIFAAIAAAFAAVQVGLIARQQPPKFATGVIGVRGPGTDMSDSIPAMISKDESVMTGKVTRRYHRELAEMELSVGNTPNYTFEGKKFATGVIGDGGFATREITSSIDNSVTMRQAIKEGLANAPAQILDLRELATKTKQIQKAVTMSEI